MVITAGTKSSPPRSTAEPANPGRAKWFYGGGAAAEDVRKPNNGCRDYDVRRIREAEKAEKIMHLICWGPTK
ncbi:hypothetical protein ACS0TY_020944 [Phlomoides rotata]